MQKSPSEPWENQVEPLKIKSALTRRGSKSKLRGPREFSPVIGSTRPRKAVTFDRTDEVITYEEITPELHDDWKFSDQSFEVIETFEENPLHTLPAIPEQRGIDKSVSEPSLHATLNENRMSRIERMDAVLDGVSCPTFRPGHKHKDSWRGSWGTITESLGERNEHQITTGYSPRVEENYLFEQLPAVTRKESLQDDQRRPKTVSMQPSAPPKITLDRTHSQRKRAIRNILGGEGSSNLIQPIAEEEDEEVEYEEDEDVMPPEIPPHSPKPDDALTLLRPNSNQPRPTSISPSLESVATFEANFGSVEHAQSSTPVLTSFDFPQRLRDEEFDFEKTRTSTPTAHPQISPRVSSAASMDKDASSEDMAYLSTEKPVYSPEALVPLAPLSPVPHELDREQMPQHDERNEQTGWQNGSDSEYSDKDSLSQTRPLCESSPASSEKIRAPEKMVLDLPEIPDEPVQQMPLPATEVAIEYNDKDINLPELSMSPRDFDAHMFDTSSTSTSTQRSAGPGNSVEDASKSEIQYSTPKVLASDDRELVQAITPQSAGSAGMLESSPAKLLDFSEINSASRAMATSNSQVSIAGSGTYDFDSSTIAVHEKHYTAPVRPMVVEEESESLVNDSERGFVPVENRLMAPSRNTQGSRSSRYSDNELDQILDNSVTQEDIELPESEAFEARPHPDFSFAENRNITPLVVAPLDISKSHSKLEVPTMRATDADQNEQAFSTNTSENAPQETTLSTCRDEDIDETEQIDTYCLEKSIDKEAVSNIHDSTSIEPLVIRPMDTSTCETGSVGSQEEEVADQIPRDPSTNMISPPTPSMAFSNPGSRVTSGASAGNNTVVHTPFRNGSEYGFSSPGFLGFPDDNGQSYLQEKHHSPMLEQLDQEDLALDSDLSDDYDKHDDNNEWVTDVESELGSRHHTASGTVAASQYSSHIPDRIPTFLSNDTLNDPSSTGARTCYNSTEQHQMISGLGFGTTPISGTSRWSIDSFREESFLSMQLGQSIEDLSTDLNRVASTTTVDGLEGDSGYILRESDSLITANADRVFKTVRRKINSRRKNTSLLESLETHQEDPAEEADGLDDARLSVRKRNEQTSFATRQPSHVVMSRNATPQRAYRGGNSNLLPEQDLSHLNTSGFVGRASSSNYGSREPSTVASSNYPTNVGIELPNRADGEVEPSTKITEEYSYNEYHNMRKPPLLSQRMNDIEEVGETVNAAQEHRPRPASSYTAARDADIDGDHAANITSATAETYRNRHKSCPVFPQEKGHFFIVVESVSGYDLPEGSMTITLDNGDQQITTEPRGIEKVTEFNEEYDLLVHDGLTCDITIRAFKKEIKDKRSSFSKLFRRSKKGSQKHYTPVSSDGTMANHRITFSDIKQYAFGKSYSAVLPCYDRMNQTQVCQIKVRMMYVPIMSRDDKPPATMDEALEQIAAARLNKVTAMTGYMTQHGGDCKKPKRRYFILDDDMLIAHSDRSFKARATINLRKAVYLAPDESDPLKFRVNFRNGAFINFTVESERQKWMEALDTTIHNKRNRSSWLSLVLYADDKPSTFDTAASQPQTVI